MVIVEDHELVARSLGAWINSQPGLRLAGWAGDGEAGLKLCLELKPALVLLDVRLPKLDGLELAAKLRAHLPDARLLALTGQLDAYTIWRALQSGLQGFLDKSQSLDCLWKRYAPYAKARPISARRSFRLKRSGSPARKRFKRSSACASRRFCSGLPPASWMIRSGER